MMAVTDTSGDVVFPSKSSRNPVVDECDLDPAAFLKSVRELSEKREREDAERFRKLEEEVQKGREERAARRAERARSISPQKQFIAVTPPTRKLPQSSFSAGSASLPADIMASSTPSQSANASDSAIVREKAHITAAADVPEFTGFGKRSSAASSARSSVLSAQDTYSTPTKSASTLARSGTLSWQQRPRPGSQLDHSRPSSIVDPDSKLALATNAPTQDPEQSRSQIAASLGTRDPSWFKQTADRGIGNAAYRKSRDDVVQSSAKRGLLGMSRDSSVDAEIQDSSPTSGSVRSDFVSRGGSFRESAISHRSHYSATSTSSSTKPDLKSLIAADAGQQEASPGFDQNSSVGGDSGSHSRTLAMSSSQARLAEGKDRAPSPTKGMGGFVQSAMMKRTDTQNKRWSAQPGASLSRQNSSASPRSDLDGLRGSLSMPKLESTSEGSNMETSSRPASASVTPRDTNATHNSEVYAKPAFSHHSRSKSIVSNYSVNEDGAVIQSPGSPSKRFSPTKSSWVESSLIKPESPKPLPSKNTQPSWMADLAKAKAQRSSADMNLATRLADGTEVRTASRPGSPAKSMPFGPALTDRPGSREMTLSKNHSSQLSDSIAPLAGSYAQTMPLDKASAVASDLEEMSHPQRPSAPTSTPESLQLAAKSTTSPAEFSRASRVLNKSSDPRNSHVDTSSTETGGRPIAEDISDSAPISSTGDLLGRQGSRPGQLAQSSSLKPMPETSTKPINDYRSQLKSRPPPEVKGENQPEFLSKFGNLRKTQTEKYVAPDLLKNNILRGKSGLAVTDGPVKTARTDELKESLLARKNGIQKTKEEGRDLPGQAHQRKTSGVPQAPVKPEALVKRDLIGRPDGSRTIETVGRTREATPEAISRQKSLKSKPKVQSAAAEAAEQQAAPAPKLEPLSKQVSEPAVSAESHRAALSRQTSAPRAIESRPAETSKLAARFNPALAGMLARGPPSATPSRPESPAMPASAALSAQAQSLEPAPDATTPLQDVRKDRAKGPKRRKGASKTDGTTSLEATPQASVGKIGIDAKNATEPSKQTYKIETTIEPDILEPETHTPRVKPKPSAMPGSAASVMLSSLKKSSRPPSSGLLSAAETPGFDTASKGPISNAAETIGKTAVAEFRGFGATRTQNRPQDPVENKENTDSSLPSAKSAASQWPRKSSPPRNETQAQIASSNKTDEEELMRSAELLAASSPKRDVWAISREKTGEKSAMSGLPPKPAKSSRVVSGQVHEASHKGLTSPDPATELCTPDAERLLLSTFGSVPKYREPYGIDTRAALLGNEPEVGVAKLKTLRNAIQCVSPDGSLKPLPAQEEYTLFDRSTYIRTHVYTKAQGTKCVEVFIWAGKSTTDIAIDAAQTAARKISKENGSAAIRFTRQGQENAAFFEALGGILITRRGSRENASKQFMLCGRKHLGHNVFDEVDFEADWLCSGFAYLISYPVTLQEISLYLWKGQAASAEELSAARLAAMDLSENGEIVEVDGGAEPRRFLEVFGHSALPLSMSKPSSIWKQKAIAPDKFQTRLFRIQAGDVRTGLFSSIWKRRPSWQSISPARSPAREAENIKVEVKAISPFTQAQLEADGLYMLDAHSELFVLIGPLFPSQPAQVQDALFAQALLFASDYAIMCASVEDRASIPKCSVVFSGTPADFKMLFRHWDDSKGLWDTASLMAGSTQGADGKVVVMPLDEVLTEVCRK